MKKVLYIVGALILLLAGCGKTATVETIDEVQYPYYIVKDKEGKEVGYMLGTIHIGKKDMTSFSDEIRRGMSEADVLQTEVELDYYLSPQKYSDLVQKYAILEGEETIYDSMTDAQIEQFKEKIATYPGESVDVSKMTRMMINSYVSTKTGDTSPLYGVDLKAVREFDRSKIVSMPFETVEQQMELLTEIQEEPSMEEWIETMPTYEENVEMSEMIFNMYVNDEIEANYDELYKDTSSKLTIDRNIAWIPQIEEQISQNKSFFVLVGTAHFYGDQGLIKLLKEKGYTVERA